MLWRELAAQKVVFITGDPGQGNVRRCRAVQLVYGSCVLRSHRVVHNADLVITRVHIFGEREDGWAGTSARLTKPARLLRFFVRNTSEPLHIWKCKGTRRPSSRRFPWPSLLSVLDS